MELGTLLIVGLVLACPLMMLFMHRGGHGATASHAEGRKQAHANADGLSSTPSLGELRSRRDELDVEIVQLEQAESDTKSPAAA